MKILLVLILCTFARANKYDGYKIYEIKSKSRAATEAIVNLAKNATQFDFFAQSRPMHVMVGPAEQDNFMDLLAAQAINYDVLNQDVGLTLQHEYAMNHRLRNLHPFNGRLGTERYYSHDEINAYIEQLAKEYPRRVFIKTVGKTYEGRWLKTITITNGDGRPNKNVIFMDGGFHAREWISPAAVIYAIEQLVEHFEDNAELLEDYDWVILPVVNADGYEYTQLSADTRLWRKTRQPSIGTDCIGTDPNRNFGFHWGESGASENPCAETYAGPHAFSEPEAVVVRDLLHTFATRGQFYLTIHSYGSMILYPWGYANILPDTVDDLHEVALAGQLAIKAETGREYTIGSSTQVLYAAAGASDDYAFDAGFPISFTMELPGEGVHGFDPPASSIDKLVKETWAGIRAMAVKVVEKYPLKQAEFVAIKSSGSI